MKKSENIIRITRNNSMEIPTMKGRSFIENVATTSVTLSVSELLFAKEPAASALPADDSKTISREAKRKMEEGCSTALFYVFNQKFGHPSTNEENAAQLLAAGLMRKGYQCGMLWGASLGVGAESFRRYNDGDQSISKAITVTQHLMKSFSKRAKSVNCNDIISGNLSSAFGFAKYFLFRRFMTCNNLFEKWTPEAIQCAIEGLSYSKNDFSQKPISCASEVVRKMGGSNEEMVMVAGFAGGLGLSGNACGALAAAVWMSTLKLMREKNYKISLFNPVQDKILKKFYETTNSEILCHKISGKCFKTIGDHTEFIKFGGCDKLIDVLAQSP